VDCSETARPDDKPPDDLSKPREDVAGKLATPRRPADRDRSTGKQRLRQGRVVATIKRPPTRSEIWASRLRPIGGWLAGILAALVTAAATAWLLKWGLLPNEPQSAPTASPQQDGAAPFTVAVSVMHDRFDGWVADRPLATLPPRPEFGGNWEDWARRAGAIPARSQYVYATVQGRSEAQVTLTGLQVRVVDRRPGVAGVHAGPGGGGPTAYRWVEANLDTDPPTMSADTFPEFEDKVPAHERRPIVFPYEVSISDAETFLVIGSAEKCDCSWIIELSWAAEGRVGTLVVDDNGKPFRVTGTSNARIRCITGGNLEGEYEDCREE
jgi:hypothetical protein